jgi:hypothetical protein
MKIVKRAAVVVISGLLMGAASSSWAAMPATNVAGTGQAEVIAAANGPVAATESPLEPSLALQAARLVRSNCKASHIYGADDVVGDKNACIMGGYAIGGGYGYGMATSVR